MDDRIYLIISEKFLNCSCITAVDLLKRDIVPSRDLPDSLETCHVAVGHVVYDYDIIAGRYKFHSHMAADIAGTTRNKYSLCHILY